MKRFLVVVLYIVVCKKKTNGRCKYMYIMMYRLLYLMLIHLTGEIVKNTKCIRLKIINNYL